MKKTLIPVLTEVEPNTLPGEIMKPVKEKQTLIKNGANGYLHYCHGCNANHRIVIGVSTGNGPVHSLRRDTNGWTVYPDLTHIDVRINEEKAIKAIHDQSLSIYDRTLFCNYWIINGVIEYTNLSKHKFANKKVEMAEYI